MKLCFLLPSNTISGGIFAVYRHVRYLESKGHDVTIIYLNGDVGEEIKLFPGMSGTKTTRLSEHPSQEQFDHAIATWWETVLYITDIKARHYSYLVQGFEDFFYEDDSFWRSYVQLTYRDNLNMFAVSEALCRRLSNDFQKEATLVRNTVDCDIFSKAQVGIPRRGPVRVMVEGIPHERRKRVNFTLEALSIFDEIEIVYVSPLGRPDFDGRIDYFFQQVPYDQMPSIYKSCDFIVKNSASESFALPVMEMFAAGGTAVVSEFRGYDEYLKHEHNSLIVPKDDLEATRQAVRRLLDNKQLLFDLSREAGKTALRYASQEPYELFERKLLELQESNNSCASLSLIRQSRSLYEDKRREVALETQTLPIR